MRYVISSRYRNCTRTTGWDGIMVVRASTGLRVAEQYGNFTNKRGVELDLPTIDCDKAFGIRLEHEGKLQDKSQAALQVALLYTTTEGYRRIRVHTLSLTVTSVMSNVFRYDAAVNFSVCLLSLPLFLPVQLF